MESGFSHEMEFGARVQSDGVRFRLWAPAQDAMQLQLESAGTERTLPMVAMGDGWFERMVDTAAAGDRYRYVLADGTRVPDPASRFQPEDVHGPSEVIDPCAYPWRDADWRGRPWREAVLYEAHVGAFSPSGDYDGVRARLDHFRDIGITALELMPLADFDGHRNWGYDGVLPFAPDSSYGRPEALKRLVGAAHARGLMVLLDVVYNHFGPSGNWLGAYAPMFFTDRHHTPWGNAIDFRVPQVRQFFIQNAIYWLHEYRFDGLRLDAVDQIRESGQPDFLSEMAETVRARIVDRHVHLILENDNNASRYLARSVAPRPGTGDRRPDRQPPADASDFRRSAPARDRTPADTGCLSQQEAVASLRARSYTAPREHDRAQARSYENPPSQTSRRNPPGAKRRHFLVSGDRAAADTIGASQEDAGGALACWYTAQWNDDFHHAAHVLATGEDGGYYVDYASAPTAALARALAEGFVYQGEYSTFRGQARGEASASLTPLAFVGFLQNHDQVGNRAFGERLSMLADAAAVEALTAIWLLAPAVPMLFMGEEWGAHQPFLYFCDFHGDLAGAVRDGRRREFAKFPAFADPQARRQIPDPNAASTFARSVLDWNAAATPEGTRRRDLIRGLLRIRRHAIEPFLDETLHGGSYALAGHVLHVEWPLADGVCLHLAANPHAQASANLDWHLPGQRLYARVYDDPSETVTHMPPWSVLWSRT